MKSIVKVINKLVLLGVVALGAVSCDKWLEIDESNTRYISFGTLDPVTQVITSDWGETMHIVQIGGNATSEQIQQLGGRVCFNFSVLKRHGESKDNVVDIRINEFYNLVVADIETISTLTEHQVVELGSTPALPNQTVISGGYVNVQIAYVNTGKDGMKYTFAMGYDDTEGSSTDNTLMLNLYHNGESSTKPTSANQLRYQWASFKLNEDVIKRYGDKPYSELFIMFRWRWWQNDGTIIEHIDGLNTSPYSTLSE